MPYSLEDKLVVAVTSRTLFNFDAANEVYETQGLSAYRQYQLDNMNTPAEPGVAFHLVQKLLRFNVGEDRRADVVILSKNDAVSGLRTFNSVREYGLDISRGVFTGGEPPFPYLIPFNAVLFLSSNNDDVQGALNINVPAATVFSAPGVKGQINENELRIAFDGDGVLFDDSGETIFRQEGLESFLRSEAANASNPLPRGPIHAFLRALSELQRNPPAGCDMRIRTALITARNAPAHERAIRTLMHWNVEVDEAFFLGGVAKKGFLEQFRPDFFFDDQKLHCEPASSIIQAAHVPYGIANSGVPFEHPPGQ